MRQNKIHLNITQVWAILNKYHISSEVFGLHASASSLTGRLILKLSGAS